MARSPSTERMRRLRRRRRDGVLVVPVEVDRDEIEALVDLRELRLEDVGDREAVGEAVSDILGRWVRAARRDRGATRDASPPPSQTCAIDRP